MKESISAARLAALVGDFDRAPAYAGLADAVRLLVGDGRIGLDVRLPSERELTGALGVSRTTVTRAYAALVESGYAVARQGAGTFTRVPGGRRRVQDRTLLPRGLPGEEDLIDLNCAAATAPAGLAGAYADALADLPAYLGGHGYFPTGLPELQRAIAATYNARGLPTDPAQIMVTPGALAAVAVVAQAFVGRGDRVLVETPVYPNAPEALRRAGARLDALPVDGDGWDLGALEQASRLPGARLAYLIPDFQNPTGHVMTADRRGEVAHLLRRSGTTAIIDEAHQALALEGQPMPPPYAAWAPDAITVGSASKSFWGGLRLGWIRCPEGRMEQLLSARVALDLGTPVLEQLVMARLLEEPGAIVEHHRSRLRAQRDALAAALAEHLPQWEFRLPTGGLAVWCRLPVTQATAVAAEAERLGVVVSPGPVFAVDGGLDRFVRIPWTRPAEDLEEAVRRLAEAWERVRGRSTGRARLRGRVMVA